MAAQPNLTAETQRGTTPAGGANQSTPGSNDTGALIEATRPAPFKMGRYIRHRDGRVHLQMRVRVYTHEPGQKPLLEDTRSLNVSVRGALITLSTSVQRDQHLILTNLTTQEEVACRVTHVAPTGWGKFKVGVEFLSPVPKFWRVYFPPKNWKPAERKRPVPVPA